MARFLFWLLLAWPTPALIAGALGWKGIWGSSSALGDYLMPLPVAGGVFHLMTFGLISVLLVTQGRWPGFLPGLARGILLGCSLAGVALLLDLHQLQLAATTDAVRRGLPWQQNPIGLFLLTDSLIAQLFVGAFGGRWPDGAKEWLFSAVATLGISAIVATSWMSADPRSGKPFVYVMSRPGPDRADSRHLVFSHKSVTSSAVRAAATTYAAEWNPQYNMNEEDIAVHFFTSLAAAQAGNEREAVMTYCMYQDGTPSAWMAGAGDCFSHETVSERLQRAYRAQDSRLSQDERLRLARAQACEGVRVPATDNAISRNCGRK